MPKSDLSSKWRIGQSPQARVQWVLQDPTLEVEAILSTDFQYSQRLSDSLLRVRQADRHFLVLTEVQLRFDDRMPYQSEPMPDWLRRSTGSQSIPSSSISFLLPHTPTFPAPITVSCWD